MFATPPFQCPNRLNQAMMTLAPKGAFRRHITKLGLTQFWFRSWVIGFRFRTTHLQRNGMVALVLAGTYTFDVICLILSGVLVGAVAYQGWRDFVHPMLQKIRSLQAMANQLDKQQNERSLPFQYFYRFIMFCCSVDNRFV
ncbi:hypothetical protein ACMD2_15976 [Ananas comosus]|uniref:Uncharacterized protein n=1 Tax=Ananas comosus TaxID=4615 RepID=A0A199VCB3_ANACO|nr:hypothetical protein ACMD2_15976 [Ananas comosus]